MPSYATPYTGFSSKSFINNREFGIYGVETIKEDLLNHIYTELGTRVHLPEFGTRIPSMIFEPNDEDSRDIVYEDLMKVFNYYPRVNPISVNVFQLPDNNAIIAECELLFVEFNVVDTLNIQVISQ